MVRENLSMLGSLVEDFKFGQAPRPPLILSPGPASTLMPRPKTGCNGQVKMPCDMGDS